MIVLRHLGVRHWWVRPGRGRRSVPRVLAGFSRPRGCANTKAAGGMCRFLRGRLGLCCAKGGEVGRIWGAFAPQQGTRLSPTTPRKPWQFLGRYAGSVTAVMTGARLRDGAWRRWLLDRRSDRRARVVRGRWTFGAGAGVREGGAGRVAIRGPLGRSDGRNCQPGQSRDRFGSMGRVASGWARGERGSSDRRWQALGGRAHSWRGGVSRRGWRGCV